MFNRHQTPVPESNLNVPPLSSPLTPGNAARQESIDKVQSWRGAMNRLRGHISESTEILEMLEPLRNGERGSEGQGGLLEKLAELKELQDDLDKMMSRAKTLSKTTWKDLESLGVTPDKHVVPIHDLEEGLHEDLGDQIDQYFQAADKVAELLLKDLTSWTGVLNITNEAGARALIDCCVRRIIPLVEGFKFRQVKSRVGSRGKFFLCLELGISRSCEEAEAVGDIPTKNLLATAGRIDYVAAYVSDWSSLAVHEQELIEGQLKNLSVVPATGIDFVENHEFQEMCFMVIEAKRPGTDYNVLLEALPQAIAEALVLGHRFRTQNETHRIIPFVLTNGARWIWGLLEPHAAEGQFPERWTCFWSEPHEMQLEHSALVAPGSARQEIKKDLRRLIDVLVYWNCAQRDRILNIVAKRRRAGET